MGCRTLYFSNNPWLCINKYFKPNFQHNHIMDAHRFTPFVYLFVYWFKAEWCELQHLLSCCGKPAGGFNPLIKWVDLRSPVEHFHLIWPSLFTTAIHVNEFRQSWRQGWQHKCQLCSNLVTYQSRIITINRKNIINKAWQQHTKT